MKKPKTITFDRKNHMEILMEYPGIIARDQHWRECLVVQRIILIPKTEVEK